MKFDVIFYRSNDWWRSKVAYIAGYVYLLIYAFSIPFNTAIPLILLIAATSTGFALLGYLINDYFDRETDAKAGKANLISRLNSTQILLLITGSSALAVFPWFFLPFDKISCALLLTELLLFVAYSATFIRLKERKILGLISDALYAHIVPPALIAYTIFAGANQSVDPIFMWLVLLWQFFVGMRNIIIHQVNDAVYDKASGVQSWVMSAKGTTPVNAIYFLRVAEALLFFALLGYISSFQPSVIAAIVISIVYYVLVLFIPQSKSHSIEALAVKFYPNYLYEKILPVILLLLLTISNFRYLPVLISHLIFFNYPELMQIAAKARLYSVKWYYITKINVFVPFWVFIKTALNYAIYYFFKIFCIDLVKENESAYGYFKKKLLPRPRD